MKPIIRKGMPADIPVAFAMVKDLAIYEKSEHEVKTSVESFMEDGFGPNPIFEFLIAEIEGQPVGLALYYFNYSTWKGRGLYLEDLVVSEGYRGQGIGEMLIDALKEIARNAGVKRMSWQVLEWNESAIRFYTRLNADLDGQWINCRLGEAEIYHQ